MPPSQMQVQIEDWIAAHTPDPWVASRGRGNKPSHQIMWERITNVWQQQEETIRIRKQLGERHSGKPLPTIGVGNLKQILTEAAETKPVVDDMESMHWVCRN